MTIEEAKQLAKQKLSSKRYAHEKNVVAAAKQLARRYGANEEKAELAGWLHDIVKEEPPEDLLRMLGQDAIIAKQTAQRPVPVWHGPCGAIYAKHQLAVNDEEILSAVGCHTTGKVGMSKLDKILYVADLISAERNFEGVEQLRQLAMQDLDAAVIAAMRQTIGFVQQRGKPLDEESMRALQDMCRAKKPEDD